jgi:hypothetical protein
LNIVRGEDRGGLGSRPRSAAQHERDEARAEQREPDGGPQASSPDLARAWAS